MKPTGEGRLESPLADRALEPLEICFVSSEYPPRMFGGLGVHVEQLDGWALAHRVDIVNVDIRCFLIVIQEWRATTKRRLEFSLERRPAGAAMTIPRTRSPRRRGYSQTGRRTRLTVGIGRCVGGCTALSRLGDRPCGFPVSMAARNSSRLPRAPSEPCTIGLCGPGLWLGLRGRRNSQ